MHSQLNVVFTLAQPLHSFWRYFSALPSRILDTNLGGSSFSIISLPFHIVHGVLKARMVKWSAIPFSSGPRFVRTLHRDPSPWVALHCMAHSFIEILKAVIQVIFLISFQWLWFSFCLASDGWGWEACASFLMGRTGCGENLVLLWWAEPCSVNL